MGTRQQACTIFYRVQGKAKELAITTRASLLEAIQKAQAARVSAETRRNSNSSRSHALFELRVYKDELLQAKVSINFEYLD